MNFPASLAWPGPMTCSTQRKRKHLLWILKKQYSHSAKTEVGMRCRITSIANAHRITDFAHICRFIVSFKFRIYWMISFFLRNGDQFHIILFSIQLKIEKKTEINESEWHNNASGSTLCTEIQKKIRSDKNSFDDALSNT